MWKWLRTSCYFKAPNIGDVFVNDTKDPFDKWTIIITDVKRGHVQYKYSPDGSSRNSMSVWALNWMFRKLV